MRVKPTRRWTYWLRRLDYRAEIAEFAEETVDSFRGRTFREKVTFALTVIIALVATVAIVAGVGSVDALKAVSNAELSQVSPYMSRASVSDGPRRVLFGEFDSTFAELSTEQKANEINAVQSWLLENNVATALIQCNGLTVLSIDNGRAMHFIEESAR
ncbi:MAG: hypothetical protein R3A47_06140 [Polyangiales bacterium]